MLVFKTFEYCCTIPYSSKQKVGICDIAGKWGIYMPREYSDCEKYWDLCFLIVFIISYFLFCLLSFYLLRLWDNIGQRMEAKLCIDTTIPTIQSRIFSSYCYYYYYFCYYYYWLGNKNNPVKDLLQGYEYFNFTDVRCLFSLYDLIRNCRETFPFLLSNSPQILYELP